ncbi:MAG TPA: hypothetical protein DCX14_14055 [Flavobacteriales bacterium]|nr:virulence promoting factor [Flavobacteriales bacterium]HAW21300.1 hypothetical protein [Flavobacteriales bacterium]
MNKIRAKKNRPRRPVSDIKSPCYGLRSMIIDAVVVNCFLLTRI